MRRRWVYLLSVVWGCGGSAGSGAKEPASCPSGRTLLDGVCVREQVADYVACVRAQGARLGEDRGQKLSAEAGFAGTRAAAASDVREKLERSYSTSDASALEIVKTCGALHGAHDGAHAEPANVADIATGRYSGEDVYADGRRKPVSVTLAREGRAYRAVWGDWHGYGENPGDTLVLGYVKTGQPNGVAVYQITGEDLVGAWTWSDGNGAAETWRGAAKLAGEYPLGPESQAKRVRVTPNGALFQVEWIYEPARSYRAYGVGVREGNRFYVGYALSQEVGVMIYRPKPRALEGTFAFFSDTASSRETLRLQ